MTTKNTSACIPDIRTRTRPAFTMRTVVLAAIASLVAGAAARGDVTEFAPPGVPGIQDFGLSVAGIPDLDGDEIDDFIIGAPMRTSSGLEQSGEAVVYSGRTRTILRTNQSPNLQPGGFFGAHVAGVGDLDNDGRGDYLVSATNELSGRGRAYLFSGATGSLLRTIMAPSPQLGDAFGSAMTAVPDATGDGVDDYLISAPFGNEGPLSAAGRAFLFNGATGVLVRDFSSPNPTADGQFGTSVTAAPDVDGDGRGDYAVGAPREDVPGGPANSGRAYAYSGATGALLRTYNPTEAQEGAIFGTCVAAIPDITGDGKWELAIGSPLANVLVANPPTAVVKAGIAELFAFGNGSLYQRLTAPTANIVANGSFGQELAGLRGLSSASLGGIVVAEPGAERVYVLKVDQAGAPLEVAQTLTPPNGSKIEPFFGLAMASAGDATGDGRDDFLIGSPNAFGSIGRAYLHRQVYNDGCGTAFTQLPVISDGANVVSTLGAAVGPTIAGCSGWTNNPGPDTWYRYTATCTGPVVFSTCSPTFDTLLAVYDGCTFAGPFLLCNLSVLLGCNDDATGCGANGSRLTVDAVAGDCFFVRLSGYDGASGVATMTITCGACPADLTGDDNVNAADLSVVLNNWGTSAGDVNGDGVTNAADISGLLGSWGACP